MKTNHFLLAAGVSLAMAFTFSCSSSDDEPSNSGGDSSTSSGEGSSSSVGSNPTYAYGSVTYDGKTYNTVRIGNQTWMAQNLNYNASGSVCYDNSESNCAKYGRLYDWATAMALPSSCNSITCSDEIQSKHKGICPSGWHIPSNTEWDALYRHADDTYVPDNDNTAAGKLKSRSGWNDYYGFFDTYSGNGTDSYGFAALPGGHSTSADFRNVGFYGFWWSSSEYFSNNAYARLMRNDSERVYGDPYHKSSLFSVRCLQD